MKLKIVKKKASSLRELGSETVTVKDALTLYELLKEVCRYEYDRQNNMRLQSLSKSEIDAFAQSGKISFGDKYNKNTTDFQKAVETMTGDLKDGLFRVFFNGSECLSLEEKLDIKDENEVVFIRLVMLAGRLW